MAWPNPFRRKDENTRSCWGYTFQLTQDHITPEDAYPLKYSYDKLGEECLDRLNLISPPHKPGSAQWSQLVGNEKLLNTSPADDRSARAPKRDLYLLLLEHAGADEKLGQLWAQVNTIPDWVDWGQVRFADNFPFRALR